MDYTRHRYRSACGRLELFARDYAGPGEGSVPLLLMHGLTRNSADFEPLAAHLAGRYRLIVPDQRGRGQSGYDPDPSQYRPDVYAHDMFALLDDLGVAAACPVGTSMGGLIAMVMAAIQPARIAAAIFNDVGPVLDPAGLARIGGYVGAAGPFDDWDAAARHMAELNREAFPTFGHEDWLAFARRTCSLAEDGAVLAAYDPAIARAFGSAPDQQPDLWPLWAALGERPVLVVRGALSDLLGPGTVDRMQQLHRGPFERVEVSGRGHAPMLDEPEALAAIDSFLARHVARHVG